MGQQQQNQLIAWYIGGGIIVGALTGAVVGLLIGNFASAISLGIVTGIVVGTIMVFSRCPVGIGIASFILFASSLNSTLALRGCHIVAVPLDVSPSIACRYWSRESFCMSVSQADMQKLSLTFALASDMLRDAVTEGLKSS